jgi:hypothetical protein
MADQPKPAAMVAASPEVPAASAQPAAPAEGAFRPKTWWQWVLIYPALALSILTAAPQWVDRGIAAMNGIYDERMSVVTERNRLFQRNSTCMAAPYNLYPEPTQGRKVDATLCPTGDIYVRVLIPDDASELAVLLDGQKYRESSDFVSLDRFVTQAERFAALEAFGMAAQAATLPQSVAQGALDPGGHLMPVQDQFALVVCQRFVDERNLLRHLQVQGQCFDETVDTFTGVTVSRVPVPCRQSC